MTIYKRQLKLSSEAAELFVPQEDLEANLRVEGFEETQLIESMLKSAIRYVEEVSGQFLSQSTYTYSVPCIYYCDVLEIPAQPVQSISSIQYYDEDNNQQTLDLSTVYVYSAEDVTTITPRAGETWPDLYDREDALVVTFVAGYSSTMNTPENLKQAVILLASHWFENRTAAGRWMQDIPFGVNSLVNASKVGWF